MRTQSQVTGARTLGWLYGRYFGTLKLRGVLADGSWVTAKEYPFAPVLFAHCERDIPAVAGLSRYSRFTVLISGGRDGDWVTRALPSDRLTIIRGSTRHQASQALSRLISTLGSDPSPGAICVDGPLGPDGIAKPGIIFAAARTGRPIIPVGLAGKRVFRIPGTWSGMWLSIPYGRVAFACGSPIWVPRDSPKLEIARLTRLLTDSLQRERVRALSAVADMG